MFLTLIVTIVLINFYIKKDIILSTIMGLILFNIYLINTYDVILITIFSFENLDILIKFTLFLILIWIFKTLNDLLSFTQIKEEIQSIFDKILKDKKIKIFTLIIISMFFIKNTFLGIVLIIFIATFLRISKYNMFLIPLSMFSIYKMYDLILNVETFVQINISGIDFIQITYIMFLTFIIIEKIRKLKEVNIKGLLIDISYLGFMFLINIFLYKVFDNMYTIKVTLIVSFIITWVISLYLSNTFGFSVTKESKEKTKIKKNMIFEEMKLPYITIMTIILLEVLSFIIVEHNFFIGSIFIIVFNISIFKKAKVNIKVDFKLLKMVLFLFLVLITIIIMNVIIGLRLDEFNFLNNKGDPLSLMLNSQNFILSPFINITTIANLDINIMNIKMLMILQIQTIFSLIVMTILSYIFSLKKNEIIQIVTLMIIVSVLLQLYVYIK